MARAAALWAVLWAAFPFRLSGFPATVDLERAKGLYERSQYKAALDILQNMAPKDSAVLLLTGQCYYLSGDAKSASAYFEKAATADPQNARAFLWAGRAYGRRAETASFFTAPGLALKAHRNFEAALKISPDDLEVIGDLFEYYLDAPGFLGGGVDKAESLSARVQHLDAAEFHYEQARLAERHKQTSAAEHHFRRAAELAPKDPGRLIDLAEFYEAQGRHRDSDEEFRRASRLAPEAPVVWFEQAKTYIQSRRNISAAKSLLQRFVGSRLTPEDPPLYEAKRLLGELHAIQ